ncbi:DinB family protein [Flavobacterium hungaricum]|uniref:DinB family protein n=1 Tax=Flavobacterium hungaricum TaxID=2082725 RepID=A0ABR9TN71_9FLAO|nr:DinB family protein [Flavobacterium hungaricum]MBE8726711.1 DinB family protein [Flavobacterium hungaricum]
MDQSLKKILWKQFGASIDMLQNAVKFCPESFWDTERQFGYNAFHCVFFLDYYLTLNPAGFTPPHPFSLSEFEDRLPERIYTKTEVLDYLQFCREKCKNLIANMTDEIYNSNWENESKTMRYNMVEILLYNMRHVQHHAAQLNLLLRENINDAPHWIRHAKDTI